MKQGTDASARPLFVISCYLKLKRCSKTKLLPISRCNVHALLNKEGAVVDWKRGVRESCTTRPGSDIKRRLLSIAFLKQTYAYGP